MNIQEDHRQNASVWMLDNRNTILLAGMMCVLIVIMIVPQGFEYHVKPGAIPDDGSASMRLIWLSLLAMGILFTLYRAGLAWLLIRSLNPFFLIFIALAFASIAWSIDPSLTVRRLVRMSTFLFVCSAFVLNGWHTRRFQNIVRSVLTIVLFGSIVFCLVDPELAIERSKSAELIGAWHGLATQKNALGALASFGTIFWFHAWLTREVKTRTALIGGSVAVICLIFSRSSTSMGTTIMVMLLLVMLLRMPAHLRSIRPFLVSMMAVLILIYALAILKIVPGLSFILDPIVDLAGKNMTFSGRTEIWAVIADHIKLHPLLGTGYAAFWTPNPIPGKPSYAVMELLNGFYPGESHNGYLETINDLGWVGMVCLLAYFFFYIRQSLQLLQIDSNQGSLFPALFFQQAISNLTEAHWFRVHSIDFVLMALATLVMARHLLDYRLRAVFGEPNLFKAKIRDDLSGHMQASPNQYLRYRDVKR